MRQRITMRKGNISYIENKKVPQILGLASKRAEEWNKHSWKWLRRLRGALLNKVSNRRRTTCRTLRSEQREAISKLLHVIFSFLDLNTMCVGVLHKESEVFAHLSLAYLAKKSGLNIRRVQRAMQWLCEAGYIVPYRRSFYDVEKEQYYHQPSIRRVNPTLFTDLGITLGALQRARIRAKQYLEKIFSPLAMARVLPTFSQQINALKCKKKYFNSMKSPLERPPFLSSFPPLYIEKLKQIMKSLPTLTIFEAQRLLPNPSAYR